MHSTLFFSLTLIFALAPLAAHAYKFTADLKVGSRGQAVFELQKILNSNVRTRVALSGPGSPGSETDYFGSATARAVIKFQELHAREVLYPASLSKGTGFVGSLTRKKLNSFAVASAPRPTVVPRVPVPAPSAAPQPAVSAGPISTEPAAPAKPEVRVTSVSPSQVRPGEKVTVYGGGFTQSGNRVTLAYGGIRRSFDGALSLDGKSISFYFEAPELKVTRDTLKKLPPEALKEVEEAVTKAGGTLDDVVTPYRTLGNIEDLEALIAKYGFTIRDLYDEFYVTVENPNGTARSHAAILAGLRKLDFSSFARRQFRDFLSRAANVALLFPKTAEAQQGGGVYSGPVFYCTCGPGHIGVLGGQGPGAAYFAPGFVPVTGTTQSAGYWLGIYAPTGGMCWMYSGFGCVDVPYPIPVYWGQGSPSPVGP